MTRGRGDAAISFGKESDEQRVKFQETVLPPGLFDQPKDETVRVTSREPEVAPAASAPRTAGRQFAPASGRETWNRRLRPRHREVVRKYFDSE